MYAMGEDVTKDIWLMHQPGFRHRSVCKQKRWHGLSTEIKRMCVEGPTRVRVHAQMNRSWRPTRRLVAYQRRFCAAIQVKRGSACNGRRVAQKSVRECERERGRCELACVRVSVCRRLRGGEMIRTCRHCVHIDCTHTISI